MSMVGRGSRSTVMIRLPGEMRRAILTVRIRGCHPELSGYHRIYGEVLMSKSVSEASVFKTITLYQRDSGRYGVRSRQADLNLSGRIATMVRPQTSHHSLRAELPGVNSGSPKGSRVINRNAGTSVRLPVYSGPASCSESRDDWTLGQSSRSSPRPGKPVTWRRRTGVCRFARKEK